MDLQPRSKGRRLLLLLLLLAAAALRLTAINSAPPGVTHDEADHALDAWGVVTGDRPIYFTTSNGREPLFDYTTALAMAAIGRRSLAARLTAVWFGMLLVAATYAWTRRLFPVRVALLTTAGIALGFWPVMVSRHALRTVTLPALFSLGLALYLAALGLQYGRLRARQGKLPALLAGGLLIGAAFYTYIPARILWLLVLGPPLYWLGARRPAWRATLPRAVGTLLIAAAVGAPLFTYLLQNPGAEQRLDQLSQPLLDAQGGSWGPLLSNAGEALRVLTIRGDDAWRYNIAGQPLLPPVVGLLFYAGLLLALVQALRGLRRETPLGLGSAVALVWLLLGLLPIMITGSFLSTTQGAGALPALYVFPALALDWLLGAWLVRRPRHRPVAFALLGALTLLFGAQTAHAYFARWTPAPAVRLQYEVPLVESLAFLSRQDAAAYALSTLTPDALHGQAVAAIVPAPPATAQRWFDARTSMVIPAGITLYSLPASAAPSPPLAPFWAAATDVAVLPLREDDLDRPVTIRRLEGATLRAQLEAVLLPRSAMIGAVARLAGVQLPAGPLLPESELPLLTLWLVNGPSDTDLVQFVHLTAEDGVPLAQADRLDAPSSAWRTGDALLQLHVITVPPDLPPGVYQLRSGLYSCRDPLCSGTDRLPASGPAALGADILLLGEITVSAAGDS